MSGLSECLRRLGLDKHESAILKGIAAENRADGMNAREAALRAVREYIENAKADREDVARQIHQKTRIDVGLGDDISHVTGGKAKQEGAAAEPARAQGEQAEAQAEQQQQPQQPEQQPQQPTVDTAQGTEQVAAQADEQPRSSGAEQQPGTQSQPKAEERGPGSEGASTEKKGGGGGQLYGGLPLDAMAKALSDAFGYTIRMAKPVASSLADVARSIADKNPVKAVSDFLHAFGSASGANIRRKLSEFNSQTATKIIDMFHVEAGSDRVTGETYQSSVNAQITHFTTRLNDALAPVIDNPTLMAQVAAQVRNPKQIRKGTPVGDAAAAVAAVLKEAHQYMRDAGVKVGEVTDGYYPREFDADLAIKEPKAFEDALYQAYLDNGADPKDARAMASELSLAVQFGGIDALFMPDRGNVKTPFTKGRVFGKSVDNPRHPLYRFLMSDPAVNITSYITRAVRRAELAKRFGDQMSDWPEMAKKIVDEGAGSQLEEIKDFIAVSAGLKRPGSRVGFMRGASFMRTWATLMFLEKATLSSLSEFMVPVIRTGNVMDAGRSLKNVVADLFSDTKLGTMKAKERRELAEDLFIVGRTLHDNINAARFSGGDPATMAQSKILDKYFKRTGLTQLTEAQRVSATDLGRVFLRRQAKGILEGSKLAKRNLAELGVKFQDMEEFAKSVLAHNDGMIVASDLQAMNKAHSDLYRSAMRRFADQSIQAPNSTHRPAWMATPMGSILGQLQSFNYSFYENVLKRQARLMKEGATGSDYSLAERAKLFSGLVTLPMLYAVGFAIGEGRDIALGDPHRREEETAGDRALKNLSRSVPIAPLDPWINYVTAARYQRGSTDFFAGPALGTFGRGLDAARNAAFNNNPKTNTAERNAAKALYDVFIEPTVNLALTGVPGGTAARVAAGAVTQAVGSGRTREQFVSAVAGKKKERNSRKQGEARL